MRKIKFKAKDKFTGEWIFGIYINDPNLAFPDAIMVKGYAVPIDPDTLCQFIKMHNGEELYDGDILSEPVEVDSKMVDSQEPVFYSEKEAAYCVDMSFLRNRAFYYLLNEYELSRLKLIGNIHDKQKEESPEKQAL